MPAQGVSMHKIREILRLHFDSKLSQHQIAASLNISSGVVNKYVCLAKAASLSWPIVHHDFYNHLEFIDLNAGISS